MEYDDYDDIEDFGSESRSAWYAQQEKDIHSADVSLLKKSSKKASEKDIQQAQKDLTRFKKISSHVDAKVYFSALSGVVKNLANASMKANLPAVAQGILDNYIRGNIGRMGYNEYYGGLMHGYHARVVIDHKALLPDIRISDDISPWNKRKRVRKNSTKYGFSLMRRRHAVMKRWANKKWHILRGKERHKYWDYPTHTQNGVRLKWMDLPLNWRGRRLKAKNGFRYRVQDTRIGANLKSGGGYHYEYRYGRKRGDKTGPGSISPYLMKFRGAGIPYEKDISVTVDPKTKQQKLGRGVFRYEHLGTDPYAKDGFLRNKLYSRGSYGMRQGIQIYNSAPYSRAVAKRGYTVLPALHVKDAWNKQIANLCQKDFDMFFKK